jgi:hypothetical protein
MGKLNQEKTLVEIKELARVAKKMINENALIQLAETLPF